MSFEYSCFISFPHGQKNVLVPIVKNFVEGLENEIYQLTNKEVWIDQNFLEGGNWLDQTIGPAMCKSACMIIIFTPLYLDKDHVYCARELKAMHELEERRLKLLEDRSHGLIIPIILSGQKYFPRALSESRIYYNFTDIESNNPRHKIQKKYAKELKKIAAYIYDRCRALERVTGALSHDCNGYCLPSADDAIEFIETVIGEQVKDIVVPFAGRTEDASIGGGK